MMIDAVEILRIVIPFRLSFRHNLAVHNGVESIMVRVFDESGSVGYGECIPREYVTGETPESVLEVLRSRMVPDWLGVNLSSFEEVTDALEWRLIGLRRHHHAAFCALELAILDLAGQLFGVSAGTPLGPVRHHEIHYSGIVSADGVKESLETCRRIRQFGFQSVKI